MMEKLVEKRISRSGLTIAAEKQKNPKPLENIGFWTLAYTTQFDTMQH